MREPASQTILLQDYKPPVFLIDETRLDIEVFEDFARVRTRLTVRRNPASHLPAAPLALDGDELQLESVSVDGRVLSAWDYEHGPQHLTVRTVPQQFVLDTVVRIEPRKNTQLMGLYAASAGFFTQCEAQGFRRISYFIDRPDVMSRFTVTIHADRERYPVLLSNGNLDATGTDNDNDDDDDDDNETNGGNGVAGDATGQDTAGQDNPGQGHGTRHWARWVDPFPKPCYLFAMVAAKLDVVEDRATTLSGREVRLSIYVDPGKTDQCAYAMDSLKRSMRWDEQVFGLELDLDQYMIVAVGDFNMGAMENKGLNIFNTKYVLARPDTATDTDFMMIDRVVAHEYFHNWTGNRVTCRDWFQLSLKEGLTVFRDQEYGADTYSRPVQRIQEVRGLRGGQFPEDAGPMAHPVRPQSYQEISNFYTATVYQKGAEVVRMIHTLIGAENFRKGMDLYFKRHDGQAVTCDDFAQAMADASGTDLTQFRRWYDQAGTPVLDVNGHYDESAQRYTLTVRQSCPPTPEREHKLPFHIPLAVGLVGPGGRDLPLHLAGGAETTAGEAPTTLVLPVREAEERFVFEHVAARPVPSLLRGFSAPVTLYFDYDEAELAHLIAHDSDSFNRWEAGQRLATTIILRGAESLREGGSMEVPESFVQAFGKVLADAPQDPAFAAEALSLPSETYLAEQMQIVDPDALHAARRKLRLTLATRMRTALMLACDRPSAQTAPYSPDAVQAGQRALRNLALGLLMELEDPTARKLCLAQYERADNMTDAMAAVTAFANSDCPERAPVLESFHERWKDEALVVDKWLSVQATSRLPGTLGEVIRLTGHPSFDIRNPNKVYALIRGFCANHVRFHAADGSGYAFAADKVIELDALNPQVASRVARAFDRWKRFDAGRQAHACAALERIQARENLSKDVAEIVSRALA